MEICRAHPYHHQQDPDHMDRRIHKPAVFSEEMNQHRRQQEEQNIAELHNHNDKIVQIQCLQYELKDHTVNTKDIIIQLNCLF